MAALRRHLRIHVRTAKYLLTCRNALPRYVAALVVIALLPIPGPVDEVALVTAAALVWFRHRPLLRACRAAALLEE